jgi:hypothetical protein
MTVSKLSASNKYIVQEAYLTKKLRVAHKNKGKSDRTCRFVGRFTSKAEAVLASNQVHNTMKRKETLNSEFNKKEEEKKKSQIALEALQKLDHDILFTNLRDWDYIGNDEFKVDIVDKAGNFHRYNYYENEGKTVWRRGPRNAKGVCMAKPVGAWVGDE